MAEDGNVIPVFIPPLATWLAQAEVTKGSRLTEAEVVRIRDGAVCMMMTAADADKLIKTRGYRDVEPENCWADWHRLRVQLTGNGFLPKIVLCILGDGNLESRCRPILEAEGVEHEWSDRDERMAQAFEASALRIDPTLKAEDLASIANHAKVLYVLSKNFTAREGTAVSRSFLRLGGRLLEAGGVALKCESTGIAHGRSRWLDLAREAESDGCWSALLRAFVQLPIQNGDDLYSCGMHLLGKPDLIVSETLLREAHDSTEGQGWEAVELFGVFALYLLSECREGQFASGHTFSVSGEAPRYRVFWEECTGYDENEFFFNPFGRWRFAEVVRSVKPGS